MGSRMEHDLELEKARLVSLALDFGFDEDSAKKCLDRLVALYGDDGRDFITVEYCGDDFLAALADSMQDTEEWDDVQAMESEACGTLTNILDKNVVRCKYEDNGISGGCIDIIEDSPVPRKHQKVVELDSSDEDMDFSISGGKYAPPGSYLNDRVFVGQQSPKSGVRSNLTISISFIHCLCPYHGEVFDVIYDPKFCELPLIANLILLYCVFNQKPCVSDKVFHQPMLNLMYSNENFPLFSQ